MEPSVLICRKHPAKLRMRGIDVGGGIKGVSPERSFRTVSSCGQVPWAFRRGSYLLCAVAASALAVAGCTNQPPRQAQKGKPTTTVVHVTTTSTSHTTTTSSLTTTTTSRPPTHATTTIPSPPTTTAPVQEVIYACSGSAPSGLAIDYGPGATGYSATSPSLPWSMTAPFGTPGPGDGESLGLTATLQAAGSVTCSVTLHYSSLYTGNQLTTVVSSANTASPSAPAFAEVCDNPAHPGDWQPCA
jgi:hypothetical protein